MALSQEFVWKPSSEGINRGALTVILPAAVQGAKISIVDPSGNLLDSSANYSIANMGRAHYRFNKPGGAYPAGSTLRISNPDGTTKDVKIDNPSSYYKTNGLPSSATAGPTGEAFPAPNVSGISPTGTESGYISEYTKSPAGTSYVMPGGVDYSQVSAPNVDFPTALANARQIGAENKATYMGNITSPETKQAALGLVQTDVEGITNAANVLAPYARAQGEQDLTANIGRAQRIDQANLSRIPEFQRFNMQQAEQANAFNQAQQASAVKASGLGYSNRMTKLLDQYSTMMEGQLPGAMNEQLTREMRNRGADMTTASGVSPLSMAGVRAQDRLNIMERIGLMQTAQQSMPGVLETAQNRLQAPTERLPTLYGSPTQIPLQTSNIEARLPVTSNISAGNAQQAIGTTATEIETIDAENALAKDLAVQQYNEGSAYNRDMAVLGAQQDYMSAVDRQTQGALNYDTQRAEASKRERDAQQAQLLSYATPVIGGAVGGLTDWATSGATGGLTGALGSIFTGAASAAGNIFTGTSGQARQSGAPSTVSSGGLPQTSGGAIPTGRYPMTTPTGQAGAITVDNYGGGAVSQPATGGGIWDSVSSAASSFANWITGGSKQDAVFGPEDVIPATLPKDYYSNAETYNMGDNSYKADEVGKFLEETENTYNGSDTEGYMDISEVPLPDKEETISLRMAKPMKDQQADYSTLVKTGGTLREWQKMSPAKRLNASGDIGVDVLADKGMMSSVEANSVKGVNNAVTTIINPNATDTQKMVSIAQATSSMTIADPADKANAVAGLSALNTVTNPNATDAQKTLALTSIGVNSADATEVISQVNAGNIYAALGVLDTGANWDNMTTLQKSISTMRSSYNTMNVMSKYASDQSSKTLASILPQAETVGNVIGSVGAGYGIYKGIDTAANTLEILNDMPKSKGLWEGTKNMTLAGAETGAGAGWFMGGPLGSGIGAVVGAQIGSVMGAIGGLTGTGKNAAQLQRDAWRNNLEKMGIAKKNDNGYHEVTLADGSKYNIGVEKAKTLTNLDGTKRSTYDVDWGNDLAVNAIPYAHLMSIASGLDPETNKKFDTFHRTVAQTINASTSNAKGMDDVIANYKSMMESGKINPRDLALRVEFLRASDKIDNQAYNVYIKSINDIFGSKILPTSKQQFVNGYEKLYGNRKRVA